MAVNVLEAPGACPYWLVSVPTLLPADTLMLPTSCVCSDANMADVADQAVNTWKVGGLHAAHGGRCRSALGTQSLCVGLPTCAVLMPVLT